MCGVVVKADVLFTVAGFDAKARQFSLQEGEKKEKSSTLNESTPLVELCVIPMLPWLHNT